MGNNIEGVEGNLTHTDENARDIREIIVNEQSKDFTTQGTSVGDKGNTEEQQNDINKKLADRFGENAAKSFADLAEVITDGDPNHPSYQHVKSALELVASLGGNPDK